MSGYLEVKSNLALNPFKTWKRQWCILRPSPTRVSGGALAVYSSEAGAAAGTVDLPPGCSVRRANSRTRPYAFAVFTLEDPRKPRILLAANSHNEAQTWMEKIRAVLSGNKFLGSDVHKDAYSVLIGNTDLSLKCGLNGMEGVACVSTQGVLISQTAPKQTDTLIPWKCIKDVQLKAADMDKNRKCTFVVDSGFSAGEGRLSVYGTSASNLVRAVRAAIPTPAISRSEGDLRARSNTDISRSSWCRGPCDVSLDDTDLIMSKEVKRIPSGQLSRSVRAGHLASHNLSDDNMSDRCSLVSVASGIYEEIAETAPDFSAPREEPTYESVADCVYATMRRTGKRFPPPPLPPRQPFSTMKLGKSWNSRINQAPVSDKNVTRHSSMGSIPRCCSVGGVPTHDDYSKNTKTLPKSRQAFSVFRKRLKSESRIVMPSPKSDTKENKDVETKKKRFDFTPSKDIFKNFRVSKSLMKNLKLTSGNLSKIGETKSCEFLDETEHVTSNRCSKSVECLETGNGCLDDYNDLDSGEVTTVGCEDSASLSLPQDIVELILRGHEQLAELQLRQRRLAEEDYMPMSPIAPASTLEQHYIVMSPHTNLAPI